MKWYNNDIKEVPINIRNVRNQNFTKVIFTLFSLVVIYLD